MADRRRPRRETADDIAALRRYAHAVTGDKDGGDLLAAAARDVLAEDPRQFGGAMAPRVALHRALTMIYNAMAKDPGPDVPPALAGPPTPLARQAFLLVALAEFSARDAARILDVGPARLAELLAEDERAAASGEAGGVLILYTDGLVAALLSEEMESAGFRVVGMPATRSCALALARDARPDIVIATGTRQALADDYFPLETAEEVQRICGAWPVILTGMSPWDRARIERKPPFVVEKPYSVEDVVGLLAALLRRRRRRRGAVSRPRASFPPGA